MTSGLVEAMKLITWSVARFRFQMPETKYSTLKDSLKPSWSVLNGRSFAAFCFPEFHILSSLTQWCLSEFAKRAKLCKVTIHLEYFSIQSMRHGRKRVVLQILLPVKWSEKNLNVSHVFLESRKNWKTRSPTLYGRWDRTCPLPFDRLQLI